MAGLFINLVKNLISINYCGVANFTTAKIYFAHIIDNIIYARIKLRESGFLHFKKSSVATGGPVLVVSLCLRSSKYPLRN